MGEFLACLASLLPLVLAILAVLWLIGQIMNERRRANQQKNAAAGTSCGR